MLKRKNFYYVVTTGTEGANGKCYAQVARVNNYSDLLFALDRIENKTSVTACSTKREAVELAEFWNECYKKNGTYLFA